MDWRAHLARPETVVAPWTGGPSVHTGLKALRWSAPPPAPGWWRLTARGRAAHCEGPAEAPPMERLPRLQGWVSRSAQRSFTVSVDGRRAEQVSLGPPEELALLTPVAARQWPSGEWLFDAVEFESGAEEAARRALERGEPLSGVKGVAAGLRAAWTHALVDRASRRLGIPASFAEARQQLTTLTAGGEAGAEAFLRALAAERALVAHELAVLARGRAQEALAAQAGAVRAQQRQAQRAGRLGTIEERATLALAGSGARLARLLRQPPDSVVVHFDFRGERFVCEVDEATLQVRDAGLCLGHPPADEALSLAALPGVIAEAMDTESLVITRHG